MIMRKTLVFILILFSSLLLFSNVLDFVPKDASFFAYFENNSENYKELKNVPLFNFLLQSMGLEFMISMNIQQAGSANDIDEPMKVFNLLSKDMVLFSDFSYDELLESTDSSIEPTEMENVLSKYSFSIVLGEIENPQELVDILFKLLNVKAEKTDGIYDLQGVYLKIYGKYVLISTKKSSIESMEKAFTGSDKLVNEYPEIITKLLSEDAWIRVFIKPPDFEKIKRIYKEQFGEEFPSIQVEKFEDYGYVKFDDGKLLGILEVKSKYKGKLPFELPEKPRGIEEIEKNIKFPGQVFIMLNVEDMYEPIKEYYKEILHKIPEIKKNLTDEELEEFEKLMDSFNGKAHLDLEVGQGSTDTFLNISVGIKPSSRADIEKTIKGEKVDANTYKVDDTYMSLKDDEIIITNLSPEDYKTKIAEAVRLIDNPLYSVVPKHDVTLFRIFVDLKKLLEKFVGMGSDSYLVLDGVYVSKEEAKFILIIK